MRKSIMRCFKSKNRSNSNCSTNGSISVVVQISSPQVDGKTRVSANCTNAHHPVSIQWRSSDESLFVTSTDTSSVRLLPGNYSLIATDARANKSPQIDFTIVDMPTYRIVGYSVVDASSSHSWNGEVHASIVMPYGDNAKTSHVRYMWNDGRVTTSPKLCHARPGEYVVTVLDENNAGCTHCTPPAQVGPHYAK